MVKRILFIGIAVSLSFLFSVQVFAENNNNNKKKPKPISCKTKTTVMPDVPSHGGRPNMALGIEGRKVNFGFSLGGSLALMNAMDREKANFGGRGTFFIHGIIPKTQTFAVGFEGGVTYLLASEKKFKETLTASTRDGGLAIDKEAQVSVGNWMLPTAQLSFMGNFHPAQRFNIQIKGNIGAVLAMVPKYAAAYHIKEIQSDGSYAEVEKNFVYNNDIAIGAAATIGTKLLYALSAHAEFGVGLDWTYMRFSYGKGWTSPEIKAEKVLTQFGLFDLHIGFAFNF